MSETQNIVIGIFVPLAIIVIGWLHFYFLPQYLIDFLKLFVDENEVIFCVPTNQHRIKTTRNKLQLPVALTIDDSPTESSHAILDVLKKYNVKATFFIISSYIPGREDVLERMIREGHELANHTTVEESSWKMPIANFERSLLECEEALLTYTQKTSPPIQKSFKWFRPGRALFTQKMLLVLKKHNYKIALANVFPNDARPCFINFQSSSPTLNSWYLRNRTRQGAIVVIHDRPWTAKTLEMSLNYLINHFHVTKLSEAVHFNETENK